MPLSSEPTATSIQDGPADPSAITFSLQIYLQCCALIDEAVTDSTVAACLQDSGLQIDADLQGAAAILRSRQIIDKDNLCPAGQQESIARAAAQRKYFERLAAAVQKNLPAAVGESGPVFPERIRRDIRLAILSHNIDRFNSALLHYFNHQVKFKGVHPVVQICNTPFDPIWFRRLPAQIQLFALHEIYKNSLLQLEPVDKLLDYFNDGQSTSHIPAAGRASFYYLHLVILLLRGNLARAEVILQKAGSRIKSFGLSGWFFFLRGNLQEALRCYEEDLELLRQINKKKNAYFTGIEGIFFIVALLMQGEFSILTKVRQIILDLEKVQPHNIFLPCYLALKNLVDCRENPSQFRAVHLYEKTRDSMDSMATLFRAVVHFWMEGKLGRTGVEQLTPLYTKARDHGYLWPALELSELLGKITGEKRYRHFGRETQNVLGLHPFTASIKHEEPWQRALKALTATDYPSQREPLKDFRMAWFVRLSEEGRLENLIPKEQKLSVKKTWTKGRVIALKKLLQNELDYLSDQDRKICATLKRESAPWGYTVDFDLDRATDALVGHPLIFLEKGPAIPVEFVAGQPELKVERQGDNLHLSLNPFFGSEAFKIIRETQTRFRVIALNRHHRRIARIIGEDGIDVPIAAKEKVFSSINMVASHVTIHSSVGGIDSSFETVPAQSRIHIHLLPVSSGFRVSFYVRPFEIDGPYCKPGIGSETIQVEINGRRIQTRRNLQLEESNARLVEESCPALLIPEDETWEWLLMDPEQCLQMLFELRSLEDSVVVEWPKGRKMAVSPQVSFDQFRGKIRKKQNWFELDGKIKIDETLVLDMRQMLNLVRKSPGRFIPIGHGQFLTLTEEFRKRLEEINAYSEESEAGVRLHPLAALAIEEIGDMESRLQTDLHWQNQLERIRRAMAFTPNLPPTLRAELRDYQREGFCWLARLAQLEVGACLADDMGLGKTVQALAIILNRASEGPTLVVAPTSVCHNWQEETSRFAPTINCISFGGRQRTKQLEKLGPFDLLITSYGMLQQEAKILAGIEWQTIVLDEAQAIKNIATKRSKAAKMLRGKFKLITTGTPIENHLGELWNLFHFINPGLLGSLDHFNGQFANPIERHNDRKARLRLRKIISPFVLRRIKSQVLEELPSKTEVVLKIKLNTEEAAFYEALRQEAVASLMHIHGPEGHRHIKILAEIMKLRLACCNPRLISDKVNIASSKMEIFGSIIKELLDNSHKALVFSQFVGHLALIREFLDRKNINYRYMDGSTPPRQRQKEVALFQGGNGDLFLISLKAGGLGLNLTAADYVIHMDPWWNPAVEDQASDRAHRIGQKHPVTIYRLVSQNTIEEKIVTLHREKRELADSLLEGTDLSGKISAEELLALLQEH